MATCSAAINTESFLHPLQRLQTCSLCLPKQRVALGRVGASHATWAFCVDQKNIFIHRPLGGHIVHGHSLS